MDFYIINTENEASIRYLADRIIGRTQPAFLNRWWMQELLTIEENIDLQQTSQIK